MEQYCKSDSVKKFNRDLKINGIMVFVTILISLVYALNIPAGKFLGPTTCILEGVLLFLFIALPSKIKLNRFKKQIGMGDNSFYKRSLKSIFIIMTVVSSIIVLIGIIFTILNYYNLV